MDSKRNGIGLKLTLKLVYSKINTVIIIFIIILIYVYIVKKKKKDVSRIETSVMSGGEEESPGKLDVIESIFEWMVSKK